MRHVSEYSMFLGILIVAFSGNWIINNYDSVSVYPKASYILFGIGLAMVVVTFMMNRFSTYHEDTYVHRKDNRDTLNKWLQDNRPFSKWLKCYFLAKQFGFTVLPHGGQCVYLYDQSRGFLWFSKSRALL